MDRFALFPLNHVYGSDEIGQRFLRPGQVPVRPFDFEPGVGLMDTYLERNYGLDPRNYMHVERPHPSRTMHLPGARPMRPLEDAQAPSAISLVPLDHPEINLEGSRYRCLHSAQGCQSEYSRK